MSRPDEPGAVSQADDERPVSRPNEPGAVSQAVMISFLLVIATSESARDYEADDERPVSRPDEPGAVSQASMSQAVASQGR